MNHRVVGHYGGDLSLANVHEPARARLERRFGAPPGERAASAAGE